MMLTRLTSKRKSIRAVTRGLLLKRGEGTIPAGTTTMTTATASPPSPLASPTSPTPKDFKPVGIPKYDGKQDLHRWLCCYSVTIEVLEGSNSTKALYFSVALESAPLTWLESLKTNSIDLWEDLKRAFINNF
jgi:hypothetical protein